MVSLMMKLGGLQIYFKWLAGETWESGALSLMRKLDFGMIGGSESGVSDV
jgi:hypothetical protein